MSTDDIAAIGAIQDLKIRRIALVAVAESRKAQPLYKAEFDRQAGTLAIEAEATAALMASPRGAEDKRAYWLAMRRSEASARASVENTVELTPGRSKVDDKLIDEAAASHAIAQDVEFCMNAPDGGIDSGTARALVADHLNAIAQINDLHLRHLATSAILGAAQAQSNYRSELAAQSPELLAAYTRLKNKPRFLESLKPAVDAECDKPTNDSRHLRAIAANNEKLAAEPRGAISESDAMAIVTEDIAALRAIESAGARKLGLLLMAQSQEMQDQYRLALLRQAPDVRVESHSLMKQQHSSQELQSYAPPPPSTAGALRPPSMKSSVVDRATAVPDSVAKHFIRVQNHYFLPNEKTPAFIDKGTKLATRGENRLVITAIVEIAKARGWEHVTLAGTEEFRRGAWLAASLAGLKVGGYVPTEQDLRALDALPPGNIIAHADGRAKPEPRTQSGRRSVDPELNPEEGADMRAKAKSFANHKRSFVVKKYPDLAPAYGTLSAAAVFAAEHLPGYEERFAKVAKDALVEMIARGALVPAPNLNNGASQTLAEVSGKPAARQDEPQRSR